MAHCGHTRRPSSPDLQTPHVGPPRPAPARPRRARYGAQDARSAPIACRACRACCQGARRTQNSSCDGTGSPAGQPGGMLVEVAPQAARGPRPRRTARARWRPTAPDMPLQHVLVPACARGGHVQCLRRLLHAQRTHQNGSRAHLAPGPRAAPPPPPRPAAARCCPPLLPAAAPQHCVRIAVQ